MGALLRYVPYPVVVGFTSGIAVIIFFGQLRDLLGLTIERLPAEFIEQLAEYARSVGTVSPPAIGIAVLSLAILILWPRVSTTIPGPMVAIVVATLAVAWLQLPVETIASRFGSVPHMLVGTDRLSIMHRRLATVFSKTMPLKILPVPIEMPKLIEMVQWHKYRDRDPARVWMTEVLTSSAASANS